MIHLKLTFFYGGQKICAYEVPVDTQFRATLPRTFIGADEVMIERIEEIPQHALTPPAPPVSDVPTVQFGRVQQPEAAVTARKSGKYA